MKVKHTVPLQNQVLSIYRALFKPLPGERKHIFPQKDTQNKALVAQERANRLLQRIGI